MISESPTLTFKWIPRLGWKHVAARGSHVSGSVMIPQVPDKANQQLGGFSPGPLLKHKISQFLLRPAAVGKCHSRFQSHPSNRSCSQANSLFSSCADARKTYWGLFGSTVAAASSQRATMFPSRGCAHGLVLLLLRAYSRRVEATQRGTQLVVEMRPQQPKM